MDGEEITPRDGTSTVRPSSIAARTPLAAIEGALRGRVEIADDFDELPDDIADAFGAR